MAEGGFSGCNGASAGLLGTTLGSGVLAGSSSAAAGTFALSSLDGTLISAGSASFLSSSCRPAATPALQATFSCSASAEQLHGRLEQEKGARDVLKLCLQRLCGTIEGYREKLHSLLSRPSKLSSSGVVSPTLGLSSSSAAISRTKSLSVFPSVSPLVPQAWELVKELESDVERACVVLDDLPDAVRGLQKVNHRASSSSSSLRVASPARSCKVLRHSLYEAQRHCENLTTDMGHQAEANQELVESIASAKEAQRHLLEERSQRSAEIAELTKQRVLCEERVDHMGIAHDAARQSSLQARSSQAQMIKDQVAQRHNHKHETLLAKWRSVRTNIVKLATDCARLQHELQGRRVDIAGLMAPVANQMQMAANQASAKCQETLTIHSEKKLKLENSISELKLQLQAEREARQAENLSWGQQVGSLTTRTESTRAHWHRDIEQLQSRSQALERSARQEQAQWMEEKLTLDSEVEERTKRRHALHGEQAALDPLQNKLGLLEHIYEAEGEVEDAEQITLELRKNLRKAEDALAAELCGKRHLQQQLEEERQRFFERNTSDLEQCKALNEGKLLKAQIANENAKEALADQQKLLEKDNRAQDDAVARVRAQLETLLSECQALDDSLKAKRSDADDEWNDRSVLEVDLQQAKHQFESGHIRLRAAIDVLTHEVDAMEEQCRSIANQTQQTRRALAAKEAENLAQEEYLRQQLKDIQETLQVFQGRLHEAANKHAVLEREGTATKEKALDVQDALERKRNELKSKLEQDRRLLEGQLAKELTVAQRARDDFKTERERMQTSLRLAQEDSRSKLEETERERAKAEELCRSDVHRAAEEASLLYRRIETLERDVTRVKTLLQEGQSNLGWLHQEQNKLEHEGGLTQKKLEEDIQLTADSLGLAKKKEESLVQQVEVQQRRNIQEKQKLLRDLEDITTTAAARLARALANSSSPPPRRMGGSAPAPAARR